MLKTLENIMGLPKDSLIQEHTTILFDQEIAPQIDLFFEQIRVRLENKKLKPLILCVYTPIPHSDPPVTDYLKEVILGIGRGANSLGCIYGGGETPALKGILTEKGMPLVVAFYCQPL